MEKEVKEKKKKTKFKTKPLLIGGAVLLVVVLLFGLLLSGNNKGSVDARKFKKEYETLNGSKAADGNKYQKISIESNNKIKYIEMSEALDIIKSGTGMIYFGTPEDALCRGAVPILIDVVDCSCLDTLYYVDLTDKRDTYEVKNDEAVKVKDASKDYYKLLSLLDEYLNDYVVVDENGVEIGTDEKRIEVPFVVSVKDGIVKSHSNGVILNEGQSVYDELTDLQVGELGAIFNNMVDDVTTEAAVCDDHC